MALAGLSAAKLMGEVKWQMAVARRQVKLKVGIRKALVAVGVEVTRQAKLRVPVSGGVARHTSGPKKGKFKSKSKEGAEKPAHLKQSIHWEIHGVLPDMEVRIGPNVAYAPFLEYGTNRIAGGAVKALGTGDDIQDSQAVFSWPALIERRASNQQMPWLRPAATMVRPRAKALMTAAMRKAGAGRGKKGG